MKQFTIPWKAAIVAVLTLTCSVALPAVKKIELYAVLGGRTGQTFSLTAGCTSGPTLPITPGSFASINTSDGLNNISIDIQGTWGGGAMTVYFAAQPYPQSALPAPTLHQVPNASLVQFTNAPTTGITSGLQDLVTTTVSGAGTLYVLTPAGLTGSVTVTVRCGAGSAQSSGGLVPVTGTVTSNAGTGWASSGLATNASVAASNGFLSSIQSILTATTSTAANQTLLNILNLPPARTDTSNPNVTYLGWTTSGSGSSTSTATWSIAQITTTAGVGTVTLYAGGSSLSFNAIWDNRLSITYS